jgi:hypothetical protein
VLTLCRRTTGLLKKIEETIGTGCYCKETPNEKRPNKGKRKKKRCPARDQTASCHQNRTKPPPSIKSPALQSGEEETQSCQEKRKTQARAFAIHHHHGQRGEQIEKEKKQKTAASLIDGAASKFPSPYVNPRRRYLRRCHRSCTTQWPRASLLLHHPLNLLQRRD